MRKPNYREFETPEIVEWEDNYTREDRCAPLVAVVAAVGIAGLATSCRPRRYCQPRYYCRPRCYPSQCYPYVSCSPIYVCYPSSWY